MNILPKDWWKKWRFKYIPSGIFFTNKHSISLQNIQPGRGLLLHPRPDRAEPQMCRRDDGSGNSQSESSIMLTDQAQSEASKKYMLGNLNYHQHISAARHQVRLNNLLFSAQNLYFFLHDKILTIICSRMKCILKIKRFKLTKKLLKRRLP